MDTTDSPPPTLWAVKLGDGQRRNGGGGSGGSKNSLVSGGPWFVSGASSSVSVHDGGANLIGDSHGRDGKDLSFHR